MRIVQVKQDTTKNDKPMKRVELDTGLAFNVFSYNDRFGSVKEGVEITKEDLYEKDGYVNLVEDPDKGRPDGTSPVDMRNQDEQIDKQMTRKEQSIRKTSTMQMAHEMVRTKLEVGALDNESDKNIRDQIMYWRNWYNDNWDKTEGYQDPGDIIDD
jgi:hypothetical protein